MSEEPEFKSLWKDPPGTFALELGQRRATRTTHERKEMDKARRRDAHIGCRNPGCEFRPKKLRIEVAHRKDLHRGLGGNPSGDRTHTSLLVCLCLRCHWAYDKLGTLDWLPQTDRGADGPVDWLAPDPETGRMEVFASEKTIGISVAVGD